MISLPQRLSSEKVRENVERIIIEPLYPAYGYTIGNGLRRVLFSSIPGAAITEFKISGISHEFSTIPGVLEDTIVIMQNLKKLRFRLEGEDPQKIFLKVKGAKEVKGRDFKIPSQLELVNGESQIATLTSPDAKLEIEALVEKGMGYLSREEREKKERDIETILIDAVFSPVKRVGLSVENVRMGKKTNFDKVILEIETDGTISPRKVFLLACEVLKNHFDWLVEQGKELVKES
ncbi:MAG: DNA-directed RNA polymerase subunit alpha [Minisyncoccales bacterium]